MAYSAQTRRRGSKITMFLLRGSVFRSLWLRFAALNQSLSVFASKDVHLDLQGHSHDLLVALADMNFTFSRSFQPRTSAGTPNSSRGSPLPLTATWSCAGVFDALRPAGSGRSPIAPSSGLCKQGRVLGPADVSQLSRLACTLDRPLQLDIVAH
jgi:hypothetical protein